MSNLLEKELLKLNIDYNDTRIYVPLEKSIKAQVNKRYIIRLSYNALHPASNSVILINWNKGLVPVSEYYKVEVNSIINDMLNVTGISYDYKTDTDTNQLWSGWLNKADIEIIAEI